MASTVPRDPNLPPEMRRFLDDLARGKNIFSGIASAAEATALLNVFTSLLKGLTPASGGGTTNFLRADGTWAAPASGLPAGSSLQVLQNVSVTNAALTGTLPIDDTVPLSSDGDEVLSQAITLSAAANKVMCDVSLWAGSSVAIAMALFRGTTCICANVWDVSIAGAAGEGSMKFMDTPGTVGPHTYSVRLGTNTGAGYRLNGSSAARFFGGVGASTLTLTEIKG
jgi:hypothetical protein